MDTQWRIELLGDLRAQQDERVITRFRTHKAGALLAYLAFYRHRTHPREVLVDLLWSEMDVEAGRNNLRQILSSLRRQFEPPGVAAGAVIVANRLAVHLNFAAVTTDVAESFFQALQQLTAHHEQAGD